jgi:hypothetical protein
MGRIVKSRSKEKNFGEEMRGVGRKSILLVEVSQAMTGKDIKLRR